MSIKKRFITYSLLYLSLIFCSLVEGSSAAAGQEPVFPPVDPSEVGLSDQALERLANHVQSMVDQDQFVGGELLVVKNRRTVLRQAFGSHDREAEQPMAIDSVYCVRSMTKPLIGTAIQMLIDEGRLRPETKVAEVLPLFATAGHSEITIEHLLTHTSGLPLTTFHPSRVHYEGLQDVAAEAVNAEMLFEPGNGFQYSDAGSDTLGAVVEKLTGESAESFIQRRILDPLGMAHSFPLLSPDKGLRQRIPSAYSGTTGAWIRHWKASDKDIFRLFLPSQGLYSTTQDYARFLALWLDRGRLNGKRLLSEAAIDRGLEPVSSFAGLGRSHGLGGLDVHYGRQWLTYTRPGTDGPQTFAFGHDGSDGTYAWAWPELDLMVLFFTQSRGTLAGLNLGDVVADLLVQPTGRTAETTTNSGSDLVKLTGIYWDQTNESAYYVVSTVAGSSRPRLSVERPDRMRWFFNADTRADRFVHEAQSDVWIEFSRDAEGRGKVMKMSIRGKVELQQKHQPRTDLPSVEEINAKVQEAHGIERLEELSPLRLTGTVYIKSRQMRGRAKLWIDGGRERAEARFGDQKEVEIRTDSWAWSHSPALGSGFLDGLRLDQAQVGRLVARYGQWSRYFQQAEVLKRVTKGDRSVLLVRLVPKKSPAWTMVVDEQSGRILVLDRLIHLPGVGLVGVRSRYDDYRDVGSGVSMPFKEVSDFATPLIGRVISTLKKADTQVKIPADLFDPPKSR